MSLIASSMQQHLAKPALTEGQLLALAARAWHDHGIVCLRPEEITDDILRQAVISATIELYGKRLDA